MNFKDLEITTVKDTVTIDSFKAPFTVLTYLPIEDKNTLIQLAIQNSEENGYVNTIKLDTYFNLYLVYMYTNIEFTENEKDDPTALYDILYSQGIIAAVVTALEQIGNGEYEYLCRKLHEAVKAKVKYNHSLIAILNGFIDRLPVNAEQAMEIINKFNPADFQQVIQFAQAANGGRPIK